MHGGAYEGSTPPCTLGESVIFGFLSAEADCWAELYFPAHAGTIKEEYIGACGSAEIRICSPITVSVAVRELMSKGVAGAVDQAIILSSNEVLCDPMICCSKLEAWIVHVPPQYADAMR